MINNEAVGHRLVVTDTEALLNSNLQLVMKETYREENNQKGFSVNHDIS